MSAAARKLLLSLVGAVAILALALGGLRLAADAAAGDYAEGMKANLKRYEGVYRADRSLAQALADTTRAERQVPAGASKLEKAAKIGPPIARFYAVNTRILKREIADAPELASVPLAGLLSPRWKAMRDKADRLEASYAEGLRLSQEAVAFFPGFAAAYERYSRVIVYAPVAAQTAKAIADLRDLTTETFGGNVARDTRQDLADRRRNDESFRVAIASTPMPTSYAARKQGVLDVIDRRIEAAKKLDAAIRAQDQAEWDRWRKVFLDNDEARYVGAYLRLCAELSGLPERFSAAADRVERQAAAL